MPRTTTPPKSITFSRSPSADETFQSKYFNKNSKHCLTENSSFDTTDSRTNLEKIKFVSDPSTAYKEGVKSFNQLTKVYENVEETDMSSNDYEIVEKSLNEIGFNTNEIMDWEKISQPKKTDLLELIFEMIITYKKPNVQIMISKTKFNCHMMVLQCYSQFFMDYDESVIVLPEDKVTSNSFIMLYKWMLAKEPKVQRDGIIELLNAATFLKVQGLLDQCWVCLDDDERCSEDAAFMLYLEAKKFEYELVQQLMLTRICKFFLTLVASKEFLELAPKEVVCLLQTNSIGVYSESEVLMSAVRWLHYDFLERERYIVEVMKCVRFGLMAPWQLVELKRNKTATEIQRIVENPTVRSMIDDGLSYVTTKHYYGNNKADYLAVLERLQLSEPVEREWIRDSSWEHHDPFPNQHITSYHSFLEYLKYIRHMGKNHWRSLEFNEDGPYTDYFFDEGKRTWTHCNSTAVPTLPSKEICTIEEEVESEEDVSIAGNEPISIFSNNDVKIRPMSICAQPINGTGRSCDDELKTHKNEMNVNKKGSINCPKHQNKTGETFICHEEKIMRTDENGGTFHVRRAKICKCSNSTETSTRIPHLDYQIGDCIKETTKHIKAHDTKTRENETTSTTTKNKGKASLLIQKRHALDSATMKQRKEEIGYILAFQKSNEVKKLNEMVKEYSSKELSKMIEKEQTILEAHKIQSDQHTEESSKTDSEYEFTDNSGFRSAKFYIFGGIDPYNPKSGARNNQDQSNNINSGNKVLTYDFKQNVWTTIANMPFSKHHHSAVVCNGLIYVIGGTKIVKDNQNRILSKSMWSFNPLNSEWKPETSMPFPRRDFAAIANEDQKGIYVIGGEDSEYRVISSTIFYNVVTKTWEQKAPLNIPRSGLMATSFTVKNNKIVNDLVLHNDMDHSAESKALESNIRKKIWAAGGLTNLMNSTVTNIIEEYDINLNKWTVVTQLRIPRCFGKMCLVNSDLYVVGGLTITSDWSSSLNAIDQYIFELKTWTLAGKMKLSKHGHDVINLNNKLFIIGGVSTVGPMSFYSVECFDTKTKKFLTSFATLPEPLSGLAAVRVDY